MDRPFHCARLERRRDGAARRIVPGGFRLLTQEVTRQFITDVGDGPASQQGWNPSELPHHMIDQGADVPRGAGGLASPLVIRHGLHPALEPVDRLLEPLAGRRLGLDDLRAPVTSHGHFLLSYLLAPRMRHSAQDTGTRTYPSAVGHRIRRVARMEPSPNRARLRP